ncbi:pectate lyase [Fusarium longipes]|uniref:Pectate lyase n=1 Tax=Fusarium longipes TaxID=694270 RepID=A0A395T4B3_9HYPO|nr:pectate lyase [Fusarium longipes]
MAALILETRNGLPVQLVLRPIRRTIPASTSAIAVATAIPVSGELDSDMVYYDRSHVSGDAITSNHKPKISIIRGGVALGASDKVVQLKGRGTVEISDFYVEDY